MGKGEAGGEEWVLRMDSLTNTEMPPRLGVGSFFEDAVTKGAWIFAVGMAGRAQTYIYKDGDYRRCDTYRGPSDGGCPIHTLPDTDEQLVINPQAGAAPLRIGTRDFASFFDGRYLQSKGMEPDASGR